jgi:THO complex subunit 7
MTAVASANSREMESYAGARTDVEDAVVKARGDIEELKSDLDSARLDRQHKEEYEALRRLCMRYPSRATTVRCVSLGEERGHLPFERRVLLCERVV